ncbi:uncharacterized protein LOC143216193 [Lasioglossum baleicum]|uniref:uncharacterized protein LOC143216193 n=1 Tax=Lasioglossum baleicum TaxID=434251 RepID=UPI003FCDF378
MAQTTLPNLASKPLTTSAMCPTDFSASTSLSDVLKSEPVKRLLNQPNIIFKAIPLNATPVNHNKVTNKMNNIHLDVKESKTKLNTTILPDEEWNEEDKNLLPSKKKGKSEIMLVPIKSEMKPCGHYEPCENIVCDVAVQQYVDREGSSPLISTNIEEDEITAPVAKHCKNEKCDALSIDHDRCRRAVVRLYRCNRSKACDICGTELQTRRCRIHHKNCTRKNEYRHNESNGAEILKVRMREREIQMMEASKLSRKDYSDPAAVMQTLTKNEELIVISKSVPVQQSQPQPQPQLQPQSQPQTNTINSIFGRLLPNLPNLVLSSENVVLGKSQCSNKNGITAPIQVATPDAINSRFIAATNSVPLAHNQYVTFTTQHGTQPLTLNDILFTQSHVMSTPIQPKPMLTPIRVVPITNLITQPSLLHQTQGVPRYCIMADPSISMPLSLGNPQAMQLGSMSLTVTNQQSIQQKTVPLTLANALQIQPSVVPQPSTVSQSSTVLQPSTVPQPSVVPQSSAVPQQSITVPKPSLIPRKISKIEIPRYYSRRKKRTSSPRMKPRLKKKEFKCEYCLKRFSTDWYFKLHVAKHNGESPYFCKICKESFPNYVELRTHRVLNHKKVMSPQDQSFLKRKQIMQQSFQCLDCPANCPTMKDLKYHRQLRHGKVACTLCHAEVRQEELVKHFATVHNRTEKTVNKIDTSIENGNVSAETFDVEDVTEIGTNSSQEKVKTKNKGKMNGHNSNFDEITIDNIKMELDYDDDDGDNNDDDHDHDDNDYEEEEDGEDDDKNDET